MIIADWADGVRSNISLDGVYKHKEGFTKSLQFVSGKERTWLTNTYVPIEYPSLSILLDNTLSDTEETELDKFISWYETTLRYGSLPFYLPRLGYKKKRIDKVGQIGVYKFIQDSLDYDRVKGLVLVKFGLIEEFYISAEEFVFLTTKNGEFLITENGEYLVM